jgi:hypothetical protein
MLQPKTGSFEGLRMTDDLGLQAGDAAQIPQSVHGLRTGLGLALLVFQPRLDFNVKSDCLFHRPRLTPARRVLSICRAQ